MSKIKNSGLDQHGAEPFEQQQFRTAGVEGVSHHHSYHQIPKVVYKHSAKPVVIAYI